MRTPPLQAKGRRSTGTLVMIEQATQMARKSTMARCETKFHVVETYLDKLSTISRLDPRQKTISLNNPTHGKDRNRLENIREVEASTKKWSRSIDPLDSKHDNLLFT